MIKNQKLLYKLPVEVARTDFLQNQNLDCLFTVKYINLNNIYFYDYNTINPNNKIIAPKGVSYIMLVKK